MPEANGTITFKSPAAVAGHHRVWYWQCTWAWLDGVDIKIVQEMLGHSTSSFTRDVYTSVVPEIASAAAEAVAAIVPRGARTEAVG
jgi:integrase